MKISLLQRHMSDASSNIVDLEESEHEATSKATTPEKEEPKPSEKVCTNRKPRNRMKFYQFIIACV